MKRDDYFSAELEKHQARFEAGHYSSLLDAFALCAMNKLPLPGWVWRPVACKLETDFATARSGDGKRGRTGGKRASADMNRVHYLRWSLVAHWLANRKELRAFGYKPTRDGAFEYTSKSLRGTIMRGSPETVRDSYRMVEKARKRGELGLYEAAGDDLRL
jgi:hypothetical protein